MPARQGYSTRTLRDFVGHGFGASAPITVDQERIKTFADVTGDLPWIHVDVARAKAESPFGGPVAGGFLMLPLLAAAVGSAGVIPAAAKGTINYGIDKIRFVAPIPAGNRMMANFKLTEVEDRGPKGPLLRLAVALNVRGSHKPALVGDVRVMG